MRSTKLSILLVIPAHLSILETVSVKTCKILSSLSKKYLVTGAAGFIASQVSKQLLDQGDQVIGVDNLNDYYDVPAQDLETRATKSSR